MAVLFLANSARAQTPEPSATPPATAPTTAAPPSPATCVGEHERSQMLRNEGKLIQQREALRNCADQNCPAIVRADCTTWLVEVENRIPTLQFSAESPKGDEPDVRVYIDGRLLTEHLDGKSIVVDPGIHDFRFELSPYPPKQLRALVREGEKERLIAVRFGDEPAARPGSPLSPVLPPPKPDKPDQPMERPVPVVVYALGGVALLGVASATYFGVTMLGDRQDAVDTCAPFCSQDRVDSIRRTGLIADVSLGVAAVSAGAALYFYLARPEVPRSVEAPPKSAIVPELRLVRQGGVLSVEGAF